MSSNTPDLAPPPRSMHLPTELLSQIILDPALSTSDLVHLCQTSRQLLHPARKALYRHLHVRMGYAKFDSIPSYRLRGVGRMCSDKRTLSLIGTLRKSPEIGNLARTIEIGNPMSPLHDLADFQCNDHREGVNELLNLVPNVMAVKHLSSHGSCLVNDAFLNRTPPILELEVASHWSHDVIKQESSLVNLRKLRIDSFLHPPAPEYSISTAPPFQNLRILDIGNWATGVPIIELPAQLVPNLHVLRTSGVAAPPLIANEAQQRRISSAASEEADGNVGQTPVGDGCGGVQLPSSCLYGNSRRFRSMIARHFPRCRSSFSFSFLHALLTNLAIPALPLSRRRCPTPRSRLSLSPL
ncbi:hypothetical protein JCM5353_008037 [Sporobolomyces roseus]